MMGCTPHMHNAIDVKAMHRDPGFEPGRFETRGAVASQSVRLGMSRMSALLSMVDMRGVFEDQCCIKPFRIRAAVMIILT